MTGLSYFKLKSSTHQAVCLLSCLQFIIKNVYRDIKFILIIFQLWLHTKVVVGWRRMALVFVFSSV